MNNKQKKSFRWFLVSLLIAAVITLLFAGCDKDNGDNDNNQGPPGAETFGSEVAQSWMNTMYGAVRDASFSPPRASRVFAYAGIAMYESIVGGTEHNVSLAGQLTDMPTIPAAQANVEYDWPTVVNFATHDVLIALFAGAQDSILQRIDGVKQDWDDEYSATVTAEVMTRSRQLGEEIAAVIVDWAAEDGYTDLHNCDYIPPVGPGMWVPTPPGNVASPLEPCWGALRSFTLIDVELDCAPPPPPAYSEETASTFYAEMNEVFEVSHSLSVDDSAIALFWADGSGTTGTPGGHWVSIVSQLAAEHEFPLDKTAEAMCRVGIAEADAFISCWWAKYEYNLVRPITCIRALLDPNWLSFITTPPFPEYTSGHSCQSGATAQVLTDFLGDVAFTDHTHDGRGLAPRSFDNFTDASEEAAVSRLYGGIHYDAAIQNGLDQGRCIGMRVSALQFHAGS